MLQENIKYKSFDIILKEVPGEISLAFSICGCPRNCEGCHSPWLRENNGVELDISKLEEKLNIYKDHITTVLFLGGEWNIVYLLEHIKKHYPQLKTALYTGASTINAGWLRYLDYLKVGPYEGIPLTDPKTNQIFYKIEKYRLINMTHLFHK